MKQADISIVFIPGLLLTGRLFDAQLAALEAGFTPVIADTTGVNSISDMAQRALSACPGPFVAVGLSMGGYVAQEMARLAPERLRGLALLNTNAMPETPERTKQRQDLIALSKIGKFKGVTPRLIPRLLSEVNQQNASLVSAVMDMAAEIGQENFVLQQTAIMHRRDQRQSLPQLTAPSMVLCGKEDTMTPPAQSEEMHALLPDNELVLIEGAGHLSTMEAPEAVNQALAALYERAEAYHQTLS